ncbi:MAG: protein kinase [Planctomycetota bacterium]
MRTEPAADDAGASALDPTLPRRGTARLGSSRRQQRTAADAAAPATAPVVQVTPVDSREAAATSGWERYRLAQQLGQGGMGRVMLAEDPTLRREIAVKLLLRSTPETQRAFIEEAQITGQLQHPNIVPIHELGIDPRGLPYLTMKRVAGRTLREIIEAAAARKTRWQDNAGEFLDIFGKVCDALSYAHSRGVIHRDLKPDNVMVGEFGEVLLMDWGLAKPQGGDDMPRGRAVRSDRRDESPDITQDGDVFGTPAYMPPEQARGDADRIDHRSDIFSLGGILYSLLTLQTPYRGASPMQTVAMAADRQLVPPRKRAPERGIPKELAAIVMMAMAAEPAKRYRNVADLKADVLAYLANLPIRARRDPLLTRLTKLAKRHPTAAMSGTLTMVFGLIVALLILQLGAADREKQQATALAEAESRRADAEAARAVAQRAQADEARKNEQLQAEVARVEKERADELSRDITTYLDADTKRAADELAAMCSKSQFWGALEDILTPAQVERMAHAADQLITLQTLLKKEPKAEYYLMRGLIRSCRGELAGAIEDATMALQIRPDYMEALALRASVRLVQKDGAGALDDINAAIRLQPDSYVLIFNRGQVFAQAGNTTSALADFGRVLELMPDSPAKATVHTRHGEMLSAAGQERAALADYERAVALRPDAHAWYNRGLAHHILGEGEQALADYNEAVRLDPDHIEARENRAGVLMEFGDTAAALADMEEALRRGSTSRDDMLNGARAARRSGSAAAALEQYDMVVLFWPNTLDAWIERASLRSARGDHAGALADFGEAIGLQPDARTYSLRAVEHLRNGNNKAAAIADYQAAWRRCVTAADRDAIAAKLKELGARIPE